jgi:tRNA (adenine57-N1/adenine58-N1)-methyltransferase catalytic subunit
MDRSIKKILIDKSGKKYFVKEIEDFHTSDGVIAAKDLKRTSAKSSKGKEFVILEPNFIDLWDNLKRGPQVMLPKDIGLILAKTGINRHSVVVDAGGGSGSLCLSLANICKEVTSYETNPEHFDILQKNKQLFGMKNLILKQANIYDGIKEKDIDLITLDLPEPWQVDFASLKVGGFVVIYLPNLTQVDKFLHSIKKSDLNVLEIVELIERKWKIEDKIMRPEFQMLGHTGFLVFCRKL